MKQAQPNYETRIRSPKTNQLDSDATYNKELGSSRPRLKTTADCIRDRALEVALKQACDGGESRWYTSTRELQLASVDLCKICRQEAGGLLGVLVRPESPQGIRAVCTGEIPGGGRIPGLLPYRVKWEWNDQPIDGVVWPDSLQQLNFGNSFNQPIAEVVWPASLQQLSFGDRFNQPIAGVVWPASLQQLSFGYRFNQPIDGVVWSASLKRLTFGENFNQPIVGVGWPASLQWLSFGNAFNRRFNQLNIQRRRRGPCMHFG